MKRMERNGKLFFVIIGMSVSTCFRRHTVLLKRECAYGKRFFVIVIIGISENALFCSWRHEISLHCTDFRLQQSCRPMFQQTVTIRRISVTFILRRKTRVAGLGASMIDTDNFEKNNTSIYVTNGVGSRFFSNFNTNAGLFCSKIENENKREFGAR
jgi:hypothetical protein